MHSFSHRVYARCLIAEAICQAYVELGGSNLLPVAVRSSSTAETCRTSRLQVSGDKSQHDGEGDGMEAVNAAGLPCGQCGQ